MSATAGSAPKVCTTCGTDVSGVKRVKDATGRYFCQACFDVAMSGRGVPPVEPRTITGNTMTPASAGSRAGGPAAVEVAVAQADGSPGGLDARSKSPVLDTSGATTARVGWNPAARPGQANLLATGKWVLMAIPVIFATAFLTLGTRLAPPPGEAGEGTTFMVLVGIVSIVGFVPLSIALAARFVVVAVLARRTGVRVASVVAAVVLAADIAFAWPRLAEVWALAAAKGEGDHPLTFADLDAKVGLGALNNPAQWVKTGQQFDADVAGMMGRRVSSWTGQVADVQGGQVLIDMTSTSVKNEVALAVGWWDRWRLEGLNRGDQIVFSGMLGGYGDPYPFTVSHGIIRSTGPGRTATASPVPAVTTVNAGVPAPAAQPAPGPAAPAPASAIVVARPPIVSAPPAATGSGPAMADPGVTAIVESVVGDWQGKGLLVQVRQNRDGSLAMSQPAKGYASTASHLIGGKAVFDWSDHGEVLVLSPAGDGTADLDSYPADEANAIDAGQPPTGPAKWHKRVRRAAAK